MKEVVKVKSRNEESIIAEWKKGHSRKWLYEQKYKSLIYQKKNKKTLYALMSRKEILEEAQHEVDSILLKWYNENVRQKEVKK